MVTSVDLMLGTPSRISVAFCDQRQALKQGSRRMYRRLSTSGGIGLKFKEKGKPFHARHRWEETGKLSGVWWIKPGRLGATQEWRICQHIFPMGVTVTVGEWRMQNIGCVILRCWDLCMNASGLAFAQNLFLLGRKNLHGVVFSLQEKSINSWMSQGKSMGIEAPIDIG